MGVNSHQPATLFCARVAATKSNVLSARPLDSAKEPSTIQVVILNGVCEVKNPGILRKLRMTEGPSAELP